MTLVDDAEREIVAFHDFLEGWLGGSLDQTDEQFERAEAVLPDEFEIVSPSGERRSGTAIRSDLRNGHGSLAADDSDPGFRIRIENVRTRFEREDSCLLTYEEWQRQGSQWEGRLSSVLFREKEGTPNGVEWVHLHETWLPNRVEQDLSWMSPADLEDDAEAVKDL
ncbi:hypothetical protein [Halorussus halophilus]|uniref:hypothetical protein n=1 Tax=Halorussus halophilus TaxID=2650975 RepID=UPI00130104DB|nr:hypothetical protein [Halorussus halophilus]